MSDCYINQSKLIKFTWLYWKNVSGFCKINILKNVIINHLRGGSTVLQIRKIILKITYVKFKKIQPATTVRGHHTIYSPEPIQFPLPATSLPPPDSIDLESISHYLRWSSLIATSKCHFGHSGRHQNKQVKNHHGQFNQEQLFHNIIDISRCNLSYSHLSGAKYSTF